MTDHNPRPGEAVHLEEALSPLLAFEYAGIRTCMGHRQRKRSQSARASQGPRLDACLAEKASLKSARPLRGW